MNQRIDTIRNYYGELNSLSLRDNCYYEFYTIVEKMIAEVKSLIAESKDEAIVIKYQSVLRSLTHTNTKEVSYIKAAEKTGSKRKYRDAFDKALSCIYSDLLVL